MVRFGFLILNVISVFGCAKGQDCTQQYFYFADVENRTAQDVIVAVTSDDTSKTYLVRLAPHEVKLNHIVERGSYVINGSAKRGGGGPVDADCSEQPTSAETLLSLRRESFNVVKNCYDFTTYKSIFVDTNATCPAGTQEQLLPK